MNLQQNKYLFIFPNNNMKTAIYFCIFISFGLDLNWKLSPVCDFIDQFKSLILPPPINLFFVFWPPILPSSQDFPDSSIYFLVVESF